MRALVTGGLGFIGRAVAIELVNAGHQVDVLSRGRQGAAVPAGTRLVEADVRDRARIRSVLADGRYDSICHLAALTRGRESFADPVRYWDVNLGGTLNLLADLAEGVGPVRLVFASTNIVYGSQHDGSLAEDLPPHPESPYANSKVAAEQMIRDAASSDTISACILRVFNAAGAVDGHGDTDTARLVPNIIRAAHGALPHISVNGDGSAVREFTHVLDTAVAFRLAVEAQTSGHETYNVGTGEGVSVREIISAAEAVTGLSVPTQFLPPKPEPRVLISNPSKIMRDLGWAPTRSDIRQVLQSANDAYISTN